MTTILALVSASAAFAPFVLGSAFGDIWLIVLRVLFFVSAILLIAIVLLQEGKGGGLAAALGGQGAETFGVSTGGVNKVTLTLAAVFLLCGVFHAVSFNKSALERLGGGASTAAPRDGDGMDAPVDEGADEGTQPADDPFEEGK